MQRGLALVIPYRVLLRGMQAGNCILALFWSVANLNASELTPLNLQIFINFYKDFIIGDFNLKCSISMFIVVLCSSSQGSALCAAQSWATNAVSLQYKKGQSDLGESSP